MSMNPRYVSLYDEEKLDKLARDVEKHEARKEGQVSGFAEGETSGIQKNKLETAKKMLEKGMTIKDIIDITGLTKEEIENL